MNKCKLCGTTENLQEHHIIPISHGGDEGFSNRMTVCVNCHKKIHNRSWVGKERTKPLITPKLHFKLDMMASKYDAPNRGMTVGQVVTGIIKSTNDLTQEEKVTLEQICKAFGATLRELEKGVRE